MKSTSIWVWLISAFVILLNHASFGQKTDQEMISEKVLALLKECQKSSGASDEEMQNIVSKKIPTTHEGLCFIECIFSYTNIMKDGKLNKEGTIIALNARLGEDATKTGKVKELVEICEKEIGEGDTDKCKAAEMIAKCLDTHKVELGIKFPTSL